MDEVQNCNPLNFILNNILIVNGQDKVIIATSKAVELSCELYYDISFWLHVLSWKFLYFVEISTFRGYYPHFVDIIRISWIYPCSVDIIHIFYKYIRL